jgi:hypothetical protein
MKTPHCDLQRHGTGGQTMSKETELKPWVKFKHWLIKKLGGHVNPKVVNPKVFECRYVENTPITLVAERQVRLRFYHTAREENEHIERQIKEDLASEISRELLKHGFLVIEKGEDPINLVTRYRAKIMVYPMKGAYYEQRKAD